METSVPEQKSGYDHSSVPTASHNTESASIGAPLDKVWPFFREFRLHEVVPGKITKTEFVSGGPGQLSSIVKISYANGSTWEVIVTEISDKYHKLCFELISAEPAVHAHSVNTEIEFQGITHENTTFIKWTTEFSNDADIQVV